MLFDLRGSGRRRVVKTVYVTLALLMGGGLVLFGIGGSGALSGGLVDAITESDGGGGGTEQFRDAEEKATAAARADPSAAGWAAVARARFNLASSGDNVDPATGEFTEEGQTQLQAASRAWEEHLELAGDKPDSRVASLMVQAYSVLGEFDKAATAQEVIALDRESVGAYTQFALLSYQANQLRKGDLARDKALKLTEPDMREALKGQFEEARAQAATQGAEGAATPAPEPSPEPEE